MDTLALGADEEHDHCKTCFSMRCTEKPLWPDSCQLVNCEMNCGMRLHKCKQIEHLQVCQNHRVPCINMEAGCPHILMRKDLGKHLEVCPASVIHCTVEWNRWPVYSAERQARVPFVQDNLHAKYGQLDVALALRDQRILNEAMKAPRSTRRALRNPLTQRFPAVPLTSKYSSSQADANPFSADTSQTVSDDDSDAPWEIRKNPPGLQKSVCNELFKATRQITESLSAAISMVTDPPPPHMLGQIPEDWESEEDVVMSQTGSEVTRARDSNASEAVEHTGEASLNTFSENLKILKEEIAKTASRVEDDVETSEYHNSNSTNENEIDDVNDNRYNVQINLKSERTKIIANINGHGCLESSSPKIEKVPSPPPAPVITLKQILALDLNIESITRYQAKPKSMYTFLCAQQFRRDEYSWHFKNVHNDIHGGLSGWLEHRCPLAHYGCTYSVRRLHPSPKGSKIVHNKIIEAFGVKPYVPESVREAEGHREALKTCIPPKDINVASTAIDVLKQINDSESLATQKQVLEQDQLSVNTKESTPEILTSKNYDSAVYINGNVEIINEDKNCDNVDLQNSNLCVTHSKLDDISESVINDNTCTRTDGNTDSSDNVDNSCNIPLEGSDIKNTNDCDILTSLPFEILTHIAKFLDPFSLGNVALTSKTLREVACSLLENRGIVLLHWERQKIGNKITWQTIYKRWMFSTAFTPVKRWGYEDNPHIGNHLRECPFYRAEPREGPILLPSMTSEDERLPHVQNALKRMYPKFVTYQEQMQESEA